MRFLGPRGGGVVAKNKTCGCAGTRRIGVFGLLSSLAEQTLGHSGHEIGIRYFAKKAKLQKLFPHPLSKRPRQQNFAAADCRLSRLQLFLPFASFVFRLSSLSLSTKHHNQRVKIPKMKFSNCSVVVAALCFAGTEAFVAPSSPGQSNSLSSRTPTSLYGLFDQFKAGGTGNSKESLDEQWAAQQEILKRRRAPKAERDSYFQKIEERRERASVEREQKWGWQTKSYGKGEDPLDEWKKRRAEGSISDLDDQYGDPKKVGGIPMPMASFGVGKTNDTTLLIYRHAVFSLLLCMLTSTILCTNPIVLYLFLSRRRIWCWREGTSQQVC